MYSSNASGWILLSTVFLRLILRLFRIICARSVEREGKREGGGFGLSFGIPRGKITTARCMYGIK